MLGRKFWLGHPEFESCPFDSTWGSLRRPCRSRGLDYADITKLTWIQSVLVRMDHIFLWARLVIRISPLAAPKVSVRVVLIGHGQATLKTSPGCLASSPS